MCSQVFKIFIITQTPRHLVQSSFWSSSLPWRKWPMQWPTWSSSAPPGKRTFQLDIIDCRKCTPNNTHLCYIMLCCYIQRDFKHTMKMIVVVFFFVLFFSTERSMGLASVSRPSGYLRRILAPLPLVRALFCETVCCTALCLVVECMLH